MQFVDSTIPIPPPPAPPRPNHPVPPWRGELRVYGGAMGMPEYQRLTKVYSNGLAAGLLEGEDLEQWLYITHLEGENARLSSELETANETRVLLADGPPAEANTTSANGSETPIEAGEQALANPSDPPEEPPANGDEIAEDSAAAKRARATRELLADPGASNPVLAQRANCSDEFVRRIRHQLLAEGKLPAVSVATK